jgi:predicted GNAT family acetyltransferase
MFHVEKMRVDDFPFAVQLANTMNWNMTTEDFEFMIKIEPLGCFVQFNNQERVGIATSVSFGKVGWFGNFIVKEKYRGEGAGSILIKHAIGYLNSKGAEIIGLYAYPHLVEVYKSFGFEPDTEFLVMQGKVAFPVTQGLQKAPNKRDVIEVIDLDRRCFGADRMKLLEPILLNKRNLCYVSTENREITGYVVAKVYGEMAEIGPLICKKNLAKASVLLLKTVLNKLDGLNVFIYIPKKEKKLLNILQKAGLKEDFQVVRMFMGPAVAKDCIYAAESLERG